MVSAHCRPQPSGVLPHNPVVCQAYQSTPATASRGVVVESCIAAGNPTPPPPHVAQYLLESGVVRYICGHKPAGDSPLVMHARE